MHVGRFETEVTSVARHARYVPSSNHPAPPLEQLVPQLKQLPDNLGWRKLCRSPLPVYSSSREYLRRLGTLGGPGPSSEPL